MLAPNPKLPALPGPPKQLLLCGKPNGLPGACEKPAALLRHAGQLAAADRAELAARVAEVWEVGSSEERMLLVDGAGLLGRAWLKVNGAGLAEAG